MKEPKRVSYKTIELYYMKYMSRLVANKSVIYSNDITPILKFLEFIGSEMNKNTYGTQGQNTQTKSPVT